MSNNFITINLYLDEFEEGNNVKPSMDLATYFNTIPRPVSILSKRMKSVDSDEFSYMVPVWRDLEGYQCLACRKPDDVITEILITSYYDDAHNKQYMFTVEDGKLKYSNNIAEVVRECSIKTRNGIICPISFRAEGPAPRPEPGPEDDFGFDYDEPNGSLTTRFIIQPNAVNITLPIKDSDDQNKWYFEIPVKYESDWLECRDRDDEIIKVYVKEVNLPSEMRRPHNLRVVGGKLYYSSNDSQIVDLFIVETRKGIKAPFKLKYAGRSPLPA